MERVERDIIYLKLFEWLLISQRAIYAMETANVEEIYSINKYSMVLGLALLLWII